MKQQTTRISAYGLITDSRSNVLLCRLSSIVEEHGGKWILPGGGLEYGEDPANAVIREVKEETGLDATLGKLLDVDSTVLEFSNRTVHAIRIIYQVQVTPGELKVEQGGSTDACDWFSQDAVKHLPMVSLTQKGMKLLGWNEGSVDQREKIDLSLSGLMNYYKDKGDPRSLMTVDYMEEILNDSDVRVKNTRRRLEIMNRYRR